MLVEAKEADNLPLHEPWYSRLSKFHRFVVIAALRPDKIVELVHTFVSDHIGFKFVDPIPYIDLGRVLSDGDNSQPVVFLTKNDQVAKSIRTYAATKKRPLTTISSGEAKVNRSLFPCTILGSY